VLDASTYSYFRYQVHRAAEMALEVHSEVAGEFHDVFGRRYDVLEAYRLEDAETVLVMAGSFATKGKAAINRWRDQGHRAGLVRLRLVRPLPASAIAAALAGRRTVAVIDQNISPGLGGILYQEVAGALINSPGRPVLRSFIGGLGGKDMSEAELDHVLEVVEDAEPTARPSPAVLLYTQNEWEQTQGRLAAAGKPAEVAP
jgi:pyruvate ferredoxin oxidoreductase alpha subunit